MILRDCYHDKHFRVTKFNSYSNRCRSENSMLKIFWENARITRRNCRYHRWFWAAWAYAVQATNHRSWYSQTLPPPWVRYTFLVDEYRTSARCFNCASELGINEKFLWVQDPRPFKQHTHKEKQEKVLSQKERPRYLRRGTESAWKRTCKRTVAGAFDADQVVVDDSPAKCIS